LRALNCFCSKKPGSVPHREDDVPAHRGRIEPAGPVTSSCRRVIAVFALIVMASVASGRAHAQSAEDTAQWLNDHAAADGRYTNHFYYAPTLFTWRFSYDNPGGGTGSYDIYKVDLTQVRSMQIGCNPSYCEISIAGGTSKCEYYKSDWDADYELQDCNTSDPVKFSPNQVDARRVYNALMNLAKLNNAPLKNDNLF
jgi:hypothetical protein